MLFRTILSMLRSMLFSPSGSYAYGRRYSVLLTAGPQYGLRLCGGSQDRAGEVWPLNVGEVCTTLQRLERDGLAGSDGGGDPSAGLTGRRRRVPDA